MTYRDGLADRALGLLARVAEEAPAEATDVDLAMWLGQRYAELFDADYCRFWWIEEGGDTARVLAHYPPIEFEEEWEYKKNLADGKTTIVSSVMNSGEPRIEHAAARAGDAESRFVTVYGAKSGAHMPMIVDGRTVGDMAMISKQEEAHFSEDDLHIMRSLANYAAAVLTAAKRAGRLGELAPN
jgi:GAF domain-containing protein